MKKIIILLLGIVVLFFAGVYFLYEPPTDKFPYRTRINGIDVSGMTIEQAENKLSESRREKDFSFVYKKKVYSVPVSSISFDVSAGDIMTSLTYYEKLRYFLRLENSFRVEMKPEESIEFLAKIKELPFCDNTGKDETRDAYVDLSDFEFRTVKEHVGTEVDPRAIRDIAYAEIEKGDFTADLTDEDMIKQPELRVGTEEFEERLKYCKDNLNFRLEYEVNGETEVITPDILDKMVKYGKKGPKFKEKKIDGFVAGLAERCNEYQKAYEFTTHGGSRITVQGVTYGRLLDQEGMAAEIRSALESQESQKLELKWAQTKYGGGKGIGDSYIETSISEQHVWLYKNGKCIVDCPCVTGAPGHDTSRGVFTVMYVTGPTTLKGFNGDGSRYESPVNCFMPFYGGQGYHGSNGWRKEWGGEIYKTAGSHGCVNCPDASAKAIADSVCSGYPVVIY